MPNEYGNALRVGVQIEAGTVGVGACDCCEDGFVLGYGLTQEIIDEARAELKLALEHLDIIEQKLKEEVTNAS